MEHICTEIVLEALAQTQVVAAAHADGEAGQLCQSCKVIWVDRLGGNRQCEHLQVLEAMEQLQIDITGVCVMVIWNDDLLAVLGGDGMLCRGSHEGAPFCWKPTQSNKFTSVRCCQSMLSC